MSIYQAHRLAFQPWLCLGIATTLAGCAVPRPPVQATAARTQPAAVSVPTPQPPPMALDWNQADYTLDPGVADYVRTHKGVPGLTEIHYLVSGTEPGDTNSMIGAQHEIDQLPDQTRLDRRPVFLKMATGSGNAYPSSRSYKGTQDDMITVGEKTSLAGGSEKVCRTENLSADVPSDPRRFKVGDSYSIQYRNVCKAGGTIENQQVNRVLRVQNSMRHPSVPGPLLDILATEGSSSYHMYYVPSLGYALFAGNGDQPGTLLSFGYTLNGVRHGSDFTADSQPYLAMIDDMQKMAAEQRQMQAEQERAERAMARAQRAAEEAEAEAANVEMVNALTSGIVGILNARRR